MGPPARSPRGRGSTFSTGATRAMPSATSDTRTGAISSPPPCPEYRSLFFVYSLFLMLIHFFVEAAFENLHNAT